MTELRRLRAARKMSREELAVAAGVSWVTIRSHELGLVNGVESKTADAIASALGVDVRDLFFAPNTDKPVITEVSA